MLCSVVLCLGSLLGASVRFGRHLGFEPLAATCFAFVCAGCLGYFAFYLYLLSVTAGTVLSFQFIAACIVFAVVLARGHGEPRNPLWSVIALAGLFGLLFLALVYWFVSANNPDLAAHAFFEAQRPHDQKIPRMSAEAVFDGLPSRTGKDVWGWYFSDRPPLQTGWVLLFSPLWLIFDRSIAYQGIATALQVSCIPAIWIMCRSIGLGAHESLLAVVASAASGFVYYNCIYAWPKLLAATFVLIAMAILVRVFLDRQRLDLKSVVVAGAAVALAMLSHGGAIYSLVPLALILSIRIATLVNFRLAMAGLGVMLALYGPWILYGKYVDPNTDRLLKSHIANGPADTQEPLGRLLVQSYARLTLDRWLDARKENFKAQIFRDYIDSYILQITAGVRDVNERPPLGDKEWPGLIANKLDYDLISLGTILRIDQREVVFRALGVLNIAWLVLIVALFKRSMRARMYDGPLCFLLAMTVLTSFWWSIAQFHPQTTYITHASFAMLLVLFCCAASALARVSWTLAKWVCAANIALSGIIWVALMPGHALASAKPNVLAVLVSLFAAALIAIVIRREFARAGDEVSTTLPTPPPCAAASP